MVKLTALALCASFLAGAIGARFLDTSEWLFSAAFSYSEDCGVIVNGDWQSDSPLCSLAAWYVYSYRRGDG